MEVAAAVLLRADGAFLLAQRPLQKVYAGYWEFPGGKVQPGESLLQALARELHEELGIHVTRAYPWITQCFTYPHATVRLHFFRVAAWQGEPHGREHQALAWTHAENPAVAPLLPANTQVLAALRLPAEYAVSNASEVGTCVFLEALEQRLAQGLRLVQLRVKTLPAAERERIARAALERCRAHGALLIVNRDLALAQAIGADGVQLSAAQAALMSARPAIAWVGVSCHSREELMRAQLLQASFAVVGPVRATPTHPDAPTLDWAGFDALVRDTPVPVYAIGGLTRTDLETAWHHGAHGIAMIRGAWVGAAALPRAPPGSHSMS